MLEMVDLLAPQLVVFPYLNAGVVLGSFTEFNAAYHAWKQADDAFYTSRITRALIALYTALAEFPVVPLNVEPADTRFRGELITQIRRLRFKFVQLNSAEVVNR